MGAVDDRFDREIMARAIALSRISGEAGEYPYGVVICREGEVVAESINRVTADRDVTRHAEVVAISASQKALRTVDLSDCTIYVNAEPCAFCSYAIRESRIGRVVYALSSPHMGGLSKWQVLDDTDLSSTIPEVFAPPPSITAGLMAAEAEEAIRQWNPVAAGVMERRRLFESSGRLMVQRAGTGVGQRAMAVLRRLFFDRFGRT
jgi:tRNA(adenine34) deaminase